MPELPEVETIVRELKPHLIQQTIQSIRLIGQPTFREKIPNFLNNMKNLHIAAIERHGKGIYFHLNDVAKASHQITLRIHLGMTGQLLWEKNGNRISSHTHVIFKLKNSNQELRYRDIRRFGQFKCWEGIYHEEKSPDAWTANEKIIFQTLRGKKGMAKHALMNQNVIAGLGNIYVDESLYLSKIHPLRKLEKISDGQLTNLCRAIKKVLGASILRGGTSFKNYVDLYGARGGFRSDLHVYGKTGVPCECGVKIKKIVVVGRGTHYCPQCQRINK